MTAVLDMQRVQKRFGPVKALDGVSFSVCPGERIALLGHNGAGKTTLFRLILAFLKPDAGSVKILGASPGAPSARRAISYLPESVAFPKNLTGAEVIALYARLKRTAQRDGVEALERVGLAAAAARRVGGYSKGMRQRLGLAIAALGHPKLVLLDEPTSGLDPQSRAEFYSYFDHLSDAGAAIIFSSHTLNDINSNAGRILILKSGALVGDGAEASLRESAGLLTTLRLRVDAAQASATAARLGGHVNGDGRIVIECAPDQKVATLARVMAAGEPFQDIDISDPSLADIFRAYSQEKRG